MLKRVRGLMRAEAVRRDVADSTGDSGPVKETAAPEKPRPTAGDATRPELLRLEAEARHHRERLALYRAKAYGPRPTSVGRLRELERASERAQASLEQARARRSRRPE